MRYTLTLCLTLLPALGFAAGPRLQLSDPGLPLQDVRPLDRQAYVLTLDGVWTSPPAAGSHYVNFLFPDGTRHSHRVLDDIGFRQGELRAVIEQYLLDRHGLRDGGTVSIVITARAALEDGAEAETVSNTLSIKWPPDRPVVKYRPRGKRLEPEPIDAFPIRHDEPAKGTLPTPRKVPERKER